MLESNLEERELMRRAAEGDREAFERAVAKHGPALTRLARALAGADSKDVVQETMLAAFQRASTYRPELGPLRPWLFAIARHQAQRLRAPPHEPAEPETLLELGVRAGWSAEDPETLTARAEDAEQLSWALASLPAADREVLMLREVEGLSGEETARVLGVELTAMKSRLHRARLKLMAALRERSQPMGLSERKEGGLTCSQVLAALSDHLDGALQTQVQTQVTEHVSHCDVCERFGGRFSRTVSALRTRLGKPTAIDVQAFEQILAHWR